MEEIITKEELEQLIHDTIFDTLCDKADILSCSDIYPFGDYWEDSDKYYDNIEKETQKWLDKLFK